MANDWDESQAKKPQTHQVGEDLTHMSADELRHRLDLLGSEIERLRGELNHKETSLAAAENVFTGRGGN